MAASASELKKIARSYVQNCRRHAQAELAYFQGLQTPEEALTRAATARLRNGKHSHQNRIPPAVLEESRRRLVDNLRRIKNAQSFDDLFDLVERISGPIHGIGELAVYDTALRIGARFGLEPTKVYLHAGTRDGAKKLLGINGRRKTIELEELPAALRSFSAREIEDLLCIYKDGPDDLTPDCRPAQPRRRRGPC